MIEVNDDLTKRGIELLRDFIKEITVKARKNKERALQQFINLINDDYLIYMSIDTLSDNNIIDVWIKFRKDFISWFKDFVDKYGINVPLDDLPDNYRARVAVLTSILLVRDLIEAQYYALNNDIRQIINSPVISQDKTFLTLYDIIRYIYPIMLWAAVGSTIHEGSEVMRIAALFSNNARKFYEIIKSEGNEYGEPYKEYKRLYLPIIITGLMNEDLIYRLIKFIDPELAKERRYRFNITGLGQAFLKLSTFVFRRSLSVAYYRTAIATLTAISRIHYSILAIRSAIINKVLETDIYGNVEFIQNEYLKYAQYATAFLNIYSQAYTHDNVLKDLSAMTFTLINLRIELNNELNNPEVKISHQSINQALNIVLRKYPFLVTSIDELVRNAIRALLYTSGRVA